MPRGEDSICQYGLSYSRGSTKLHMYEKTASICVNPPVYASTRHLLSTPLVYDRRSTNFCSLITSWVSQ